MRKVLLGLAGFVVIAFAASLCYADDGETAGLKYSLDLNKLFGATVEGEEKMEWKFTGWGQIAYGYSGGTYNPTAPAGPRTVGGDETLNAWRFRFCPSGKYKWLSWGCQYETAATLTLLDFWANMDCQKYKGKLMLKIGQFIPPFGIERPISPYKITTINYSRIVAYLFGGNDPLWGTWGNLRDSGMMVHGKMKYGQEADGFQPNVYYGVGVFNGEPANTPNSDPFWTFFMTLKLMPMKGMLFGISYEDGSRTTTAISPGTRNVNRDRFGLCWKIEKSGFLVMGEYIVGNMNSADIDKHDDEANPATMWHLKKMNVDGWYLVLGYYLKPKKIQALFKVDILDPPAWSGTVQSREGVAEHDIHYRKQRMYGIGFNWFINPHCKVQVMYEQTQNEGRAKLKKIARSEQRGFIVFGVNF